MLVRDSGDDRYFHSRDAAFYALAAAVAERNAEYAFNVAEHERARAAAGPIDDIAD